MKRVQSLATVGVTAFAFLSATIPLAGNDCTCRRPEKGETTHWGGNEMIVVDEEESYRRLAGTIVMPDDRRLENVHVEVFDHPDYLLDQSLLRKEHPQKRLAACRTAVDGKFCFHSLPSGVYELRASIGAGWNVTHVHVRVDTKNGSSEDMRVIMTLGT